MTFTQFLLPDGRRREIVIARPPEIEALAAKLMAKGYRLEIEMLITNQISMAVEPGDAPGEEEFPIAMEICHNGPTDGDALGVPESVDKMITEAAKLKGLLT